MLEKPDLKDETVVGCLLGEYGLNIDVLTFLPLGADLNTAVYRAEADRGTPYFVKLRRGDFDPASIAVPNFLRDLDVSQIIPALPTRRGQFWADLDPYKVIVYPFVAGHNGFEVDLSDQQRIELGTALKKLHTAAIPATITASVPREDFSPQWRERVKSFLARSKDEEFVEPVARELAAYLAAKHDQTLWLVQQTEQRARLLKERTPEFVLCHGDIHGWNLLIDGNDRLYMVDWDTLIFAPKERDLMFVGCGLGGNGHTLQEEEVLFYQGYGQTQVNPTALAYYRYERIIEDIAVICDQIFSSDAGGADRLRALEMLESNFRPNGTIELASQANKRAKAE